MVKFKKLNKYHLDIVNNKLINKRIRHFYKMCKYLHLYKLHNPHKHRKLKYYYFDK